MTNYYFHNIPNSQALGYALIITILTSGIIIRALYWLSENYKQLFYSNTHVYLAVIGKLWLQRLSLLTTAVMTLLAFNIDMQMYGQQTSSFFAVAQFSVGWWCVIRIVFCALASLSTCLYDSNMAFRLFCMTVFPLLAVCDMLSELSLMQQYNCIVNGTCVRVTSTYTHVNLMMWRDMASIVLTLTCTAMSCWLCAVYGWGDKRLYLPKLEHRMVSKRMVELNVGKPAKDRKANKYVS